jgi:uncharacterized protein
MWKILRGFPVVAAMIVAAGLEASAQNNGDLDRRQIVRVVGEAVAVAQPDEVWLDIGVITEASTAQAAAAENARKVEKVLAALRGMLGSGASIRTSNYSINPNYRGDREGRAPTISGYIVSNTVEVRTTDMANIGKVIDAAIKSEANNVNRVQFTLRDRTQPMATALKDAIQKARAKADAMAAALGMRVLRVISVEEGGGGAMPIMMQSRMMDGAYNTQIEAGVIDVHAMVALTAEVGP